ncbi:MAG TPA: EthD domain-containing protein [Burkholderiales bacterium]|nr:EthD domain-containing protein [Burkholderiales bacterium]
MNFKVIRMVKRRAGESREDFAKRWRSEHPKQAVVTLATGEIALGGAEAPFDGMSATYFDSALAARAAAAQFSGDIVVACDEHAMGQKPDPQTRIKIVRTVYKRRDLTHQQFKDYWLKNHSKLEDRVIAESPVQRIIATFALPEAGADPAFDGMVELYFASPEDIRAMFAGPIPAMMRKDEENFVQMDAPAIRAVCQELASGN